MHMSKQLFTVSEDGQSERFGSTCCSLEENVSARSAMAIFSAWDGCGYAAILSTDLENISLEKYFYQ